MIEFFPPPLVGGHSNPEDAELASNKKREKFRYYTDMNRKETYPNL